MTEQAGERRRSDDIAGELHQVGREALLDGDSRALFLGSESFDGAEPAQGLAAAFVDDSCCSSYVSVGELRDVLLQEVDQAAVSLKDSQKLQRCIGGRGGHRLGLRLWRERERGLGSLSELRRLGGEVFLEEDLEEARERKDDAI